MAHLARNEEFQAVAVRVDLLLRTQQILDARWPGLNLQIIGIRHESALIGTPNASVAAKCRQLEPSMIDALKPLHPGMMQIKFRPVQRRSDEPGQPRSQKRLISQAALDKIDSALTAMPAGTGKDALARLLRRRRP